MGDDMRNEARAAHLDNLANDVAFEMADNASKEARYQLKEMLGFHADLVDLVITPAEEKIVVAKAVMLYKKHYS